MRRGVEQDPRRGCLGSLVPPARAALSGRHRLP